MDKTDELFLRAFKEGFWYIEDGKIKRCSPSIDLYKVGCNCKEDIEHNGGEEGIFMYLLHPIKNHDIKFTLNNYGILWAIERSELAEAQNGR